MIYGDTGWRAICRWDATGTVLDGTMPAGLQPNPGYSGGIFLHRDAQLATIGITEARSTNESPTMDCPLGFRGSPPYPAAPITYTTPAGAQATAILEVGASTIRLRGMPAGGLLRSGGTGGYAVMGTWRVGGQWPAILPGASL